MRFSEESRPRLTHYKQRLPVRSPRCFSAGFTESMPLDECPTCDLLSKFYSDCLASIQKLKDLARTAQSSNELQKMNALLDTPQSLLETEAAEILVALTEHRKRNYAAGAELM